MAFSANPEDYTNRGNIITPLKDRIDSQIITHYPKSLDVALKITSQEAWTHRQDDLEIHIPESYRKILEHVAFEARDSEYIDQKSGVSTRMTITAMEQVISAAERRAIYNDSKKTSLRITDLYAMVPALTGKLELVYEGEQEGAVNVAKHIIGKAINKAFKEQFPDPSKRKSEESSPYNEILSWFENGNILEIPDLADDESYQQKLDAITGLSEMADKFSDEVDSRYAIMDLLIEALHQNSKIGKNDLDDNRTYSDMLGSMLGNFTSFDDDEFIG